MVDVGNPAEGSRRLSLLPEGDDESSTGDSTFENYISRFEAYSKIAKEMMSDQRFKSGATGVEDLLENGKWTPVSEDRKQTGLMSICPALSAMLSMDVDLLNDKAYDMDEETNTNVYCCREYRTRILAMLQFIVDYISVNKVATKKDKTEFVYDASPYIVQKGMNIDYKGKTAYQFTPDKSFIGSICWVGDVMVKAYTLATTKDDEGVPYLKLRRIPKEVIWGSETELPAFENEDAESKEHNEVLAVIKQVIKDCIDKVVQYVIKVGDKKDGTEKILGWSFTSMSQSSGSEMSLYFTYRVADLWLALFKCLGTEYYVFRDTENLLEDEKYEQIIRKPDYWSKENFEELLTSMASVSDERRQTRGRNRGKVGPIEDLRNRHKAIAEDYEKINFLFELNDKKNITDISGNFARFKSYLLSVAQSIWDKYGEMMDDRFFYSDFSIVPEGAIGKDGATDVLFNTLFMQGIMISGALDVELEKQDAKERMRKKESNLYKTFLDTMESALQKILDQYTTMRREGNDYKVDRYYLRLDTDRSRDELTEKLRKANIVGHVLIPLLTKVNSLLSEYIVRYPQKQMKNYLDMILSNSVIDDGEPRWAWDSDGYAPISNYYYVDSIIDFYTYYEKYERKYLLNKDRLKEIEDNQKGTIKELKETVRLQKQDIDNLKKENKDIASELKKKEDEDTVSKYINKIVENAFEEKFFSQFGMFTRYVREEEFRSSEEGIRFSRRFDDFANAMLLAIVMGISDESYKVEMKEYLNCNGDKQLYEQMAEKMRRKIKQIMKEA